MPGKKKLFLWFILFNWFQSPKCALELLSLESGIPILLRWTTTLANIMKISGDSGITSTTLPCEYKAASPETLYSTLHGMDNHAKLKSKIFLLCKHPDEGVQTQATKIHQFLTEWLNKNKKIDYFIIIILFCKSDDLICYTWFIDEFDVLWSSFIQTLSVNLQLSQQTSHDKWKKKKTDEVFAT